MKKEASILDLTGQVQSTLIAKGISAEVAARVSAIADIEIEGERDASECRETITLGYPVSKNGFTRLKDAAVTNMPATGLAAMLEDDVKLATFIDMGMRATPATLRLELPTWVLEKSTASDKTRMMQKAKAAAQNAANEAF